MTKLTKRTVDALAPRGRDYFVWDQELKGFGVRVLTSGRKTFLAQYRSAGLQRRIKLGVYGPVTAEQARLLARQVLGATWPKGRTQPKTSVPIVWSRAWPRCAIGS